MPVHEYKQTVEYYDVSRFIHKTLIIPQPYSVLPVIDGFQVVIASLYDSKPKTCIEKTIRCAIELLTLCMVYFLYRKTNNCSRKFKNEY